MEDDKILDKVRKLLKLSESSNANESAAAAAKAQQLIDEHNLSAALLAVETGEPEDSEPIEDSLRQGSPLDKQTRLSTWRYVLAESIAKCNSCQIYNYHGAISLVGRRSDADKVRYLYGYLTHETERLCNRDGCGCGITWRNNYRMGVVDTIYMKLRDQHSKFKAQAREQVALNSLALVKVDKALARIEAKDASVADWARRNLRLVHSSVTSARGNQSARQAGRIAGQSISIGQARAALN